MLDQPSAPAAPQTVTEEILHGLTARQKYLAPKFFYDQEGVRLFGEITRLPEYYLTRTETALLQAHGAALSAFCPAGGTLVEWGASDETKASFLLAPGHHIAAYVPIDIAASALTALASRLGMAWPDLTVHPIIAEFGDVVVLPPSLRRHGLLGFFPGSTIGNFTPPAAAAFLRGLRATLGPDAALILGADMVKDPALLLAAYNDAAGVTAAFNRNCLKHVNALTGSDFDPQSFTHQAIWNAQESRIEMHLRSQADQTVRLAGQDIVFSAGETIHTENSYKFTHTALMAMSAAAGYSIADQWQDKDRYYSLVLLRPMPDGTAAGGA